MPGSKVPVIRQPFARATCCRSGRTGPFSGNHLYDLRNDPDEDENRAGESRERDAADQLREALKDDRGAGRSVRAVGVSLSGPQMTQMSRMVDGATA